MNRIFLSLFSLLSAVHAATITHDFNITWVYANPDNSFVRPVIGINNQWPVPAIFVTKGDRLVVNINNQLGNETTSLHWHGIFQNGTTHMDGPVDVTQCDVAVGGSFTYNFTIDQPGTYWFHSHSRGQYPDGLRAPLIVIDPDSPYKDQYDEEIVVSFSDWYHDLMKPLLAKFISVTNPTGAEPVPDAALMNDTQGLKVTVEPGKTYLFRMINVGAFAAQYVWFEGHDMRIVEVDGVYTEISEPTSMLYMTAAQRYSVLVTMRNNTNGNFAIVGSMDQDLFDTVPPGLNPNVTGWLVYDESKPMPEPTAVDSFEPFDDFTLTPQDGEQLFDNVSHSVTLDLKMDNLGDGANYAFFNDITYVPPKVPTLYTAMSTGQTALNPAVYGVNTNSFVLEQGEVVEIVLNNDDPGKHPFHLHGHNFQTLVRSDDEAGFYDPEANVTFPSVPMRRDTVLVRPNGHFVIRFRADNPGIWLFHCHIEWHVTSGLIATFVEAPLALQGMSIPESHLQACAANDPPTPTAGNAAGNTVDLLDLSGNNEPPAPLPEGFTTKGIVAMTFSVLAAVLGVAVIAWYGAMPITEHAGKDLAENIAGREAVQEAVQDEMVDGNMANEAAGSSARRGPAT